MTRLLDIVDLSTGYNGVPVVRHLDLHVDAGEVVALLGPNGAGKTTTLLTVSQLVPIISGDITVLGESVKGAKAHLIARRGLAHVPRIDRSSSSSPSPRTCASVRRRALPISARRSPTFPHSRVCSTGAPGSSRVVSSRCWRWRGR